MITRREFSKRGAAVLALPFIPLALPKEVVAATVELEVGDFVRPVDLGPPIPGVITAFTTGELLGFKSNDLHVWEQKFPGWYNKKVAIVQKDRPHKCMTLFELREYYKDEVVRALSETVFTQYQNLPGKINWLYPIDCLVLMIKGNGSVAGVAKSPNPLVNK
jgi:hypothetical protein